MEPEEIKRKRLELQLKLLQLQKQKSLQRQQSPEKTFANELAEGATSLTNRAGNLLKLPLQNPITEPLERAGETVAQSVEGIGSGMMDRAKAMEVRSPGDSALKKLGKGMGAMAIGSAGAGIKFLGDVGKLTPTNMALAVGGEGVGRIAAPAVASALGKGGAEMSGMMTGTGGMPREAFLAGREGGAAQKAFTGVMRGEESMGSVADDAIDAFEQIKTARGKMYSDKLSELQAKYYPTQIDYTGIKTKLDDLLDKFNIVRKKNGKLVTKMSAIDDTAVSDIERITKTVDEWEKLPGGKTFKGLDILKRKLGNYYSPNGQARAFVSGLASEIKKTIKRAVPEYTDLVKPYEEVTNVLNDIKAELSLGGKSGTIERKLRQTLRPNFELRKEFVDILEKAGKKDIIAKIAGAEANQWMPKGLMRAVAGGNVLGATFLHNPAMLSGLPLTSPRIAGETALKIGQASRMFSPQGPKALQPYLKATEKLPIASGAMRAVPGVESPQISRPYNDQRWTKEKEAELELLLKQTGYKK